MFVTRSEINAHPSVIPHLEAWREARKRRDRVLLDKRYGEDVRRQARAAADAAEKVYDDAVREVYAASMRRRSG